MKLYPSHLVLYQQCPLRYKFKYIDRLPEETTPELYLGSRLHDTLAAYFKLPAQERSLERLKELFRAQWAGRNLPSAARRRRLRERYEAFKGERDLERTYGLRGLEMLERFYKLPLLQVPPFRTEEFLELPLIIPGKTAVEWEFDEELILAGKVDRIDTRPDGTLRIIDYKTGQYVPEDEETFRALDEAYITLPIYALLVEHLYGKPVTQASLFYLSTGQFLHFEFSPEELQGTRERVIEIAREILTTAEFKPVINNFCPCGFQDQCPLDFDEVPF